MVSCETCSAMCFGSPLVPAPSSAGPNPGSVDISMVFDVFVVVVLACLHAGVCVLGYHGEASLAKLYGVGISKLGVQTRGSAAW